LHAIPHDSHPEKPAGGRFIQPRRDPYGRSLRECDKDHR
jgi:hypothetical protein